MMLDPYIDALKDTCNMYLFYFSVNILTFSISTTQIRSFYADLRYLLHALFPF